MGDALSLDYETVAAQTPRRKPTRPHGIGSAEVALAMLSFGLVDEERAAKVPGWMRDNAAMMKTHAMPAWLARKIGLAKKPKLGAFQLNGIRREREILEAWQARLRLGEFGDPREADIDPESVVWAPSVIPEFFPPFKDRFSPIVVQPDAWCRTVYGERVGVSVKCAAYGMWGHPPWWYGITTAPWYYKTQCDAEVAALSTSWSVFLVGCGWNRDAADERGDGPLLSFAVDTSRDDVKAARAAARRAWDVVLQHESVLKQEDE